MIAGFRLYLAKVGVTSSSLSTRSMNIRGLVTRD